MRATLNSSTASPCRVYLRYHHLTLTGNKADLLARIKAHLGS